MSEGTGPIRRPAVTSSDVLLAAGLLRSRVHRTPVLTSTTADRLATECLGGSYPVRLAFKCENLQRIGGTFFIRLTLHFALTALQPSKSEEQRTRFSKFYNQSPNAHPRPLQSSRIPPAIMLKDSLMPLALW
ncbi:hypothetical protein FRC12_001583, partial [Ceratobasidium sp. 428]